jgi:lysylphosphatidylglycerol synthetase-like protein (DUF2156 family)
MHPVVRAVTARLRHQPVAFAVTALILGIALASVASAVPPRALREAFATGFGPVALAGHWWSPLTAIFFTDNLAELIVVVVLCLTLLGWAERLLGSARTAIAFVVTPVVGTVLGVLVQAAMRSGGAWWSHDVRTALSFDPVSAIAGTLMAASAFGGLLVRRRIRVFTLLAVLVLLLYSGQPADLYRIMAVAIGWGLGLLFRPPARLTVWPRSSHHEIRVLMASVVAATAVGPAYALFSGSRFGPLAPVALLLNTGGSATGSVLDDCSALNLSRNCINDITLERISGIGPIVLSVLPLATLLFVAYGLLRGRRFAVWLGVLMNAGFAVVTAYYLGFLPRSGVPYVIQQQSVHYWGLSISMAAGAVLPAGIAVLLVVFRRHFVVLAPRSRIAGYLATVGGAALVLTAIYVVIGSTIRSDAFSRTVAVQDLLADALERFIPVSFLHRVIPNFVPTTPAGALLYHGIGPAFWCVVFIAAIPPLLGRQERARGTDAVRARAMLEAGTGDGLAFMTTWPGNSYWFDNDAHAAIAYRVVGAIALTTGGPFGSWPPRAETVHGFARFCDDNGWVPVFYSTDASMKPIFDQMAWGTMVVAEETVVELARWNTTGKKWQDVRSSINRAERAGIRTEWTTYGALPLGMTSQLAELSEQWVADKQLPEMGFTLGGLDELQDQSVALMLAIDADGNLHGVTSWLPAYRDGAIVGWTLDFMRRRADSINGVMEFVIARAAERMREDGIEWMSLSAAPLAHTQSAEKASGATERFLASLSGSLEPIYGFRSLLKFKLKFQPDRRRLLMAYPDPVALPRIGFALVRAYLPGLSVRQVARIVRSNR